MRGFAPFRILTAPLVLIGTACSGGDSGDSAVGGGDSVEVPLQFEPIVQYEQFQWEGRPVFMYIPPDPKGVVWLFHGTNGNTSYCREDDTVAITNLLLLEGVGFICSQSLDQGPENKWDLLQQNFDENEDVQFLLRLHEHVTEVSDLELDDPQFAMGFSNGGDMSGFFAVALEQYGFDVRATAPHNSSGHIYFDVPVPMIVVIPVNDNTGRIHMTDSTISQREERGLRTDYLQPPEITPVTAEWFLRNPKVALQSAQTALDHLAEEGLITDGGVRLVEASNPNDLEDVETTLESALTQFEKQYPGDIARTEDLRVAWAIHRMNAYYAYEVRDFFLDYLD